MSGYTKNRYSSISSDKLDELMSIYNDYLYMARVHEQSILLTSDKQLAEEQIADMYPNGFEYPWHIEPATTEEKREFDEFCANDSNGNGKSTYISLRHVKDEENHGKHPVFTPHPYESINLGMQLPSSIEHFKMAFPENSTLGNTKFIIDGRYKAVYTGEDGKDKTLEECISDPDLQTKIVIMINTSERFRRNKYLFDEDFSKDAMLVYAEEKIAINENNLLEIIGSFSEAVKNICQEKYQGKSGKDDIIRAQREGFLNLPDNFLEYDDIRNYIRHQWECVHEWELFMPKKPQNPEEKRIRRVNSYLKYCDKSIYQRMRTYIDVLHQMQGIIAEVKPNRLIRNRAESRNKFKKRVKETVAMNPDMPIEVELNYLQMSKEFHTLGKDLRKIVPDIKIVDNVTERNVTFEFMYNRMEDYKKRSDFLQSFHSVECMAIGRCVTHGKVSTKDGENEEKNLNTSSALNYLQEIGVISWTDYKKWREYTKLRNSIAHTYFSDDLRNQIHSIEKQYNQDLKEITKKLLENGPEVRKLYDDVFEYTNSDGTVVELDHKNHCVLSVKAPTQQAKAEDKKYETKPKENFRKGNDDKVKIKTTSDGKIKGVRLEGDVYIDISNRSINWGANTRWYTNAEKSNYLHAGRSVLRTDKNLYLKEYHIGKSSPSFREGDNMLIDNRHRLLLDSAGRIKEFKFKGENGKTIKTLFEHKSNGTDRISFEDGTNVLFSGKDVLISHNGVILSDNNRKEFLATYNRASEFSPRFSKYGNER